MPKIITIRIKGLRGKPAFLVLGISDDLVVSDITVETAKRLGLFVDSYGYMRVPAGINLSDIL